MEIVNAETTKNNAQMKFTVEMTVFGRSSVQVKGRASVFKGMNVADYHGTI